MIPKTKLKHVGLEDVKNYITMNKINKPPGVDRIGKTTQGEALQVPTDNDHECGTRAEKLESGCNPQVAPGRKGGKCKQELQADKSLP